MLARYITRFDYGTCTLAKGSLLESEDGSDVSVGRDPPEQVVVGHVDGAVGGGGHRLGRQQPLPEGGTLATVTAAVALDGPLLAVAHHGRHNLGTQKGLYNAQKKSH